MKRCRFPARHGSSILQQIYLLMLNCNFCDMPMAGSTFSGRLLRCRGTAKSHSYFGALVGKGSQL
eukprot:6212887-Pleurochrysis_carterae.AAC.6